MNELSGDVCAKVEIFAKLCCGRKTNFQHKPVELGTNSTQDLNFGGRSDAQNFPLNETDLKIKVLNQQIIDNKAAVDSVYNDLEQVKKVIEAHKESMKKIK